MWLDSFVPASLTHRAEYGTTRISAITLTTLLALTNTQSANAALWLVPAAQKTKGAVELENALTFQVANTATGASYLVFEGLDFSAGLPNSSGFGSLDFEQADASDQSFFGVFVEASAFDGGDIRSDDAVVLLSDPIDGTVPRDYAPVFASFSPLGPEDDGGGPSQRSITLHSGTWNFDQANSAFSELIEFSGLAYLADGEGNRVTNQVAVPEPSAYALFLGGIAVACAAWRRKRRSTSGRRSARA